MPNKLGLMCIECGGPVKPSAVDLCAECWAPSVLGVRGPGWSIRKRSAAHYNVVYCNIAGVRTKYGVFDNYDDAKKYYSECIGTEGWL